MGGKKIKINVGTHLNVTAYKHSRSYKQNRCIFSSNTSQLIIIICFVNSIQSRLQYPSLTAYGMLAWEPICPCSNTVSQIAAFPLCNTSPPALSPTLQIKTYAFTMTIVFQRCKNMGCGGIPFFLNFSF